MHNVARPADLVKVLWHDELGMSLYAKRLERGRFVWPQAQQGAVALTPAALSMLLEGLEWRAPATHLAAGGGGLTPA